LPSALAPAAPYLYNHPLVPRRPNDHLGEFKGCSVFRYVRIADSRREAERERLRMLHHVTRSMDRRAASR
jgi:hypothetical protein